MDSTTGDNYLISKVFHWSIAATNTPDVVQMSHAIIHRQQNFSFLQSSPNQQTQLCQCV